MPQLDLSDDNEATMSTENSLLAPKERAINMVVTVSSKKKCEKLKNYLKDLDEKLKEVTNKCEQLEASNKKLLVKYKEGDAHNKRKRKKSWSEYSVQYKNKKLKCLAANINEKLKCADDNFIHRRVEMANTETGEIVTVENQDGKPVIKSKEANKESEDSLLRKNLYIKDKYNISNEAYHELAMTNPEIPSSYRLLKTVKEINSESIIRSTTGKAIGIQQSLKERLMKRLHHLLKVNPNFQQSVIQVKITGDGTCVTRDAYLSNCVYIGKYKARRVSKFPQRQACVSTH